MVVLVCSADQAVDRYPIWCLQASCCAWRVPRTPGGHRRMHAPIKCGAHFITFCHIVYTLQPGGTPVDVLLCSHRAQPGHRIWHGGACSFLLVPPGLAVGFCRWLHPTHMFVPSAWYPGVRPVPITPLMSSHLLSPYGPFPVPTLAAHFISLLAPPSFALDTPTGVLCHPEPAGQLLLHGPHGPSRCTLGAAAQIHLSTRLRVAGERFVPHCFIRFVFCVFWRRLQPVHSSTWHSCYIFLRRAGVCGSSPPKNHMMFGKAVAAPWRGCIAQTPPLAPARSDRHRIDQPIPGILTLGRLLRARLQRQPGDTDHTP